MGAPVPFTDTELTKAMNKAKVHLMSLPDQTFLAHVMCRTLHEFDTSTRTAGTDGIGVLYGPKFFMEHCTNVEERAGLILHELFHIILEHPSRFKEQGLDHPRANAGADYYINLMIDKIPGVKLPKGGLLDHKYEGWSFREIYDSLPADIKPPMDDLLEPGSTDAGKGKSKEQIKQQIDQILVEASSAAQRAGDKPGSIPGDVRRYVDKLLNPKVPWWRVLRRFMIEYAKTDYSMSRPNRRFYPYFLPTLHGEAICDIMSSVDTSGSVTDKDFQRYVTENVHIMHTLKPKRFHFLQFDTKVKDHAVCRTVQDLKEVEFKGRGGTKIDPVMEFAVETKPKLLLVFTDGFFRTPQVKPKCPVIWVIVGNPKFTAPFGRVIHYDPKE